MASSPSEPKSGVSGGPSEPQSGSRYVALIGDIRGSREAQDRAALQERFQDAVQAVNGFYEALPDSPANRDKLVSPLVITTGDEFQGLLGGTREAVGAVAAVSDLMAPTTLRFGLGLGGLETPVNPDQATGMDGPCLRRARQALDQAEAEDGWLRTRGFGDVDPDLGRLVDPVGVLRARWTDRQLEFVRALRRHGTQKEVARELGVSESTVSESLRSAAYRTVKEAQEGLQGLLAHAAARSPGGDPP